MSGVTRAAIAAALSDVPDLAGSEYRPATPGAGQAWPVWRSTGLEQGGCARVVRWYVLVCLVAGDEPSTSSAADVLLEPVIGALRALGLVIELAEPVRLPLESGQSAIPALRVAVVDHVWVGAAPAMVRAELPPADPALMR